MSKRLVNNTSQYLVEILSRNIFNQVVWGRKKKILPYHLDKNVVSYLQEISTFSCNPLIDLLNELGFDMPFCTYYSIFKPQRPYSMAYKHSASYHPQRLLINIRENGLMQKRDYIGGYDLELVYLLYFGGLIDYLKTYRSEIQKKIIEFSKQKGFLIEKTSLQHSYLRNGGEGFVAHSIRSLMPVQVKNLATSLGVLFDENILQ